MEDSRVYDEVFAARCDLKNSRDIPQALKSTWLELQKIDLAGVDAKTKSLVGKVKEKFLSTFGQTRIESGRWDESATPLWKGNEFELDELLFELLDCLKQKGEGDAVT